MTVDKLKAHYGLTRTPFSRSIAPAQIFQARTHEEAVARLRWLVDETAIGVITGEVERSLGPVDNRAPGIVERRASRRPAAAWTVSLPSC